MGYQLFSLNFFDQLIPTNSLHKVNKNGKYYVHETYGEPNPVGLERQTRRKQMGRPINKRFFGANANNNIRVRFHNGSASVDGAIVSQRGSKEFKCIDASGNTAVCKLVNKADGSLASGEMSIKAKADDGTLGYVIKISARKLTAVDSSGAVLYTGPWNFSTSTSDTFVQIEEAGTNSVFAGNIDITGNVA